MVVKLRDPKNANSRTLAERAVNKVRSDFKLEISKSKLMFEFSRSPENRTVGCMVVTSILRKTNEARPE